MYSFAPIKEVWGTDNLKNSSMTYPFYETKHNLHNENNEHNLYNKHNEHDEYDNNIEECEKSHLNEVKKFHDYFEQDNPSKIETFNNVSKSNIKNKKIKIDCDNLLEHVKECSVCRHKLRIIFTETSFENKLSKSKLSNGGIINSDILTYLAIGFVIIYILDLFTKLGKRRSK
jgi:hypothetical protein